MQRTYEANAKSDENEMTSEVKSSAVVKYSAVNTPEKYSELQYNTNLNRPPANWLRKIEGLGGYGGLDMSRKKEFSSFHMANNFPDCIGEVDVVSDAENIKKLLKIPYSKAQVSMLIHRIGKTILVDEFDIHMHLLRTTEKDWQWLRNFYFDTVLQSLHLKEKGLLRKNKSRYHLQHKSMFSKFLYHSIEKSEDDSSSVIINNQQLQLDKEEVPEQNRTLYGDHKFLRDVLWTFEDITMLIGTDMPIFGGGTHPCVSLRLRDKNKPINILTGLDYWLDNLMCNVPEIMMCYHLNGIVQQYELLKTEDLPKLNNCNFSPNVIKDVAQNILSFLKSNATKVGHTYWLFKGKDDDVVKLYDLTTLCRGNLMDNKGQNPFAIHVAILFYTLARNLHSQPYMNDKSWATIHFLLLNCIHLLRDTKTPQLLASAEFLLADILMPQSSNNAKDKADVTGAKFVLEEVSARESAKATDLKTFDKSPTVDVEYLCLSHRRRSNENDNALVEKKVTMDFSERCQQALEHTLQGLDCVNKNKENWSAHSHVDLEELQERRAKPSQAIPLKYTPLNAAGRSKQNCNISSGCTGYHKSKRNCWMALNHQANCPLASIPWQVSHKLHLLEKSATTIYFLAEECFAQERYGRTLRYLQMIFLCLEGIESLSATCDTFEINSSILPNCLGLTGDVHFMLARYHNNLEFHVRDYQDKPNGWDILQTSAPQDCVYFNNYLLFWQVDGTVEEHLNTSKHCYDEALAYNCDKSSRLNVRLGNTLNELGVYYMNKAKHLHDEKSEAVEELNSLCKDSAENLRTALEAFISAEDKTNIALVSSNLGRLMRLQAYFESPREDPRKKEFSHQERKYFQKAIQYYDSALTALKDDTSKRSLKESITWDYSSVLFNMATLLQDFAPLSKKSQKEVEEEITSLLNRALELCELNTIKERQFVYQYRAATIHHRLASLHHHAIRNQVIENQHKQKESRLLAEKHYEESGNLYALLKCHTTCLEVRLEHFGMYEYFLPDKLAGSSRARMLYRMLEILMSIEENLRELAENSQLSSDHKEENDIKHLLPILQKHLQMVLLNLMKSHKGNPSQMNFYKELYTTSLKAFISISVQTASLQIPSLHEISTIFKSVKNHLKDSKNI